MCFPLGFCYSLCMLHNLSRTLGLCSHLEVLRILEHRHRHLLWGHLVTAALNDFSCPLILSDPELNARRNEPDFPFDVVWAVLDRVTQEADSLLAVAHTVVGLRRLYVDLPVKLFRHILEHLIQDCLKRIKFCLTALFVHFLVESKILEPQRTILCIVLKSFFTNC